MILPALSILLNSRDIGKGMKEAGYYDRIESSLVVCRLCPHHCRLQESQYGICQVRKNVRGTLYTEVYGKVAALHLDPIEKKPLYHYYPGRSILSIGTVGCNLQCNFCQNWHISQACVADYPNQQDYTPEQVAGIAFENRHNLGVAYTYNEPVVYYEYMKDIAILVHEGGGKNVMVSNGYINPRPLEDLFPVMDAFSIDLKAFTDDFYRRQTRSGIQPVKDTLIAITRHGKHLEITNLIIPGLNDDPGVFEEMVQWIREATGTATVLHLSRYFPGYRATYPATPHKILDKLFVIAKKYLSFVYLGNISGSGEGHNTSCPSCGNEVVVRSGYYTRITGLDKEGHCTGCGTQVLVHI